jgi:hypothetical protein
VGNAPQFSVPCQDKDCFDLGCGTSGSTISQIAPTRAGAKRRQFRFAKILINKRDTGMPEAGKSKEYLFMRTALLCMLSVSCLVLSGGCSWVGHTAGKAQAKIERKADSLEQGYQKGYEEEKAKTGSN